MAKKKYQFIDINGMKIFLKKIAEKFASKTEVTQKTNDLNGLIDAAKDKINTNIQKIDTAQNVIETIKESLPTLATKAELVNLATKVDLDLYAKKTDLTDFVNNERLASDLSNMRSSIISNIEERMIKEEEFSTITRMTHENRQSLLMTQNNLIEREHHYGTQFMEINQKLQKIITKIGGI